MSYNIEPEEELINAPMQAQNVNHVQNNDQIMENENTVKLKRGRKPKPKDPIETNIEPESAASVNLPLQNRDVNILQKNQQIIENENLKDDSLPDIAGLDIATAVSSKNSGSTATNAHKRRMAKSKIIQLEIVTPQVTLLSNSIKSISYNTANDTLLQHIIKASENLQDIVIDNNKLALFLRDKSIKEAQIKKYGIGVLSGIDKERYDFLKSANDLLPDEDRLEFFICESFIDVIERKVNYSTSIHLLNMYAADGGLIKKNSKNELKKRKNTFKSLITLAFNPDFPDRVDSCQIEKPSYWESKGEVKTHFEDYSQRELLNSLGSNLGPYRYNPWMSSDDEEAEPIHKTTTYKSHFLLFWPNKFDSENIELLEAKTRARTTNIQSQDQAQAEEARPEKPPPRKASKNNIEVAYGVKKAGCFICHNDILKNTLRMGVYVETTNGYWKGVIPQWHHLDCAFKNNKIVSLLKNNKKQIFNLEYLRPEDEKKVIEKWQTIFPAATGAVRK